MKTKVFLIILLVFVFLTLISCKNVTGDEKNHQSEIQAHNIMKFDLTDFTWEIENFHCDLNVGSLENADDVIVSDITISKENEYADSSNERIKVREINNLYFITVDYIYTDEEYKAMYDCVEPLFSSNIIKEGIYCCKAYIQFRKTQEDRGRFSVLTET